MKYATQYFTKEIQNFFRELFKDDKYAEERESVTKTVQDLFLKPTELNMQNTLGKDYLICSLVRDLVLEHIKFMLASSWTRFICKRIF